METAAAADVLLGRDPQAGRFIGRYAAWKPSQPVATRKAGAAAAEGEGGSPLRQAVIFGRREQLPGLIDAALAEGRAAAAILNDDLIPGIMHVAEAEGAAGSVAQVRAVAAACVEAAKRGQACLILVGHVTKDGQIAGPKLLEHMDRTGTGEVLMTFSATEPNRNLSMPRRPWVPRTIISAFISSAALTISSAA